MNSVFVQTGLTIFDVALLASGDASRAFDIVDLNPQLDNINSPVGGLTLYYEYSAPPKRETVKVVQENQKVVTVMSDQTLFDIALQLYGSPEYAVDLIDLNGSITNLTDEAIVNLNVNYIRQFTAVPVYFDNNNITVATRYPIMSGSFLQQENLFYILQENGYKIKLNA